MSAPGRCRSKRPQPGNDPDAALGAFQPDIERRLPDRPAPAERSNDRSRLPQLPAGPADPRGDLLLARAQTHATLTRHTTADAPADRWPTCATRPSPAWSYRNRPPSTIPRYPAPPAMEPGRNTPSSSTPRSAGFTSTRTTTGPRFVADYYISHGKLGTEKSSRGRPSARRSAHGTTSPANLPARSLRLYGNGASPSTTPTNGTPAGRDGTASGCTAPQRHRPVPPAQGHRWLRGAGQPRPRRPLPHLQIGTTPVIISNTVEWLAP